MTRERELPVESITHAIVCAIVAGVFGFVVHSCRLHSEHADRIEVQRDRITLEREKHKPEAIRAALEGCRITCGDDGVRTWSGASDGQCVCD